MTLLLWMNNSAGAPGPVRGNTPCGAGDLCNVGSDRCRNCPHSVDGRAQGPHGCGADLPTAMVCFCGHRFHRGEVAAAYQFHGHAERCEDSACAFDDRFADTGSAGDGRAGGRDTASGTTFGKTCMDDGDSKGCLCADAIAFAQLGTGVGIQERAYLPLPLRTPGPHRSVPVPAWGDRKCPRIAPLCTLCVEGFDFLDIGNCVSDSFVPRIVAVRRRRRNKVGGIAGMRRVERNCTLICC
jgi:hypothetical protein